MYFKTEGLVLRETEYKDTDKLLTVLSKDRGRLTLRARGVRSRNSKLKGGCQLLSFSEFTVFEGKTGQLVQEAVPLELFLPIRQNIEWLSLTSYFAQVAEVLSQEDSPSPELLSLCLNAMYALGKMKRPQRLVKAVFEFRAACLAGYEPMLERCAVCGNPEPERFLVSAGMLQCTSCHMQEELGLRLPVHGGCLSAMRYLASCDSKHLFSFTLGADAEKELADVAETYLLTQLERGFFTLDFYKSMQITT